MIRWWCHNCSRSNPFNSQSGNIREVHQGAMTSCAEEVPCLPILVEKNFHRATMSAISCTYTNWCQIGYISYNSHSLRTQSSRQEVSYWNISIAHMEAREVPNEVLRSFDFVRWRHTSEGYSGSRSACSWWEEAIVMIILYGNFEPPEDLGYSGR